MNWIISTVIIILFFSLPPSLARAQVILNEISPCTNPEWIELYNLGPESVDLTNWYFKDAADNKKLVIAPEPLGVGGYYVASGYTNWLNNTGGESLYLYNAADVLVDSVSFGETSSSTVVARIPDLTGGWLLSQLPTPQASNTQPTPTPTPTPTASPSASPLPTPQAVASTPSPSPTLAPAPSPSPIPPSSPSPSPVFPSPTPFLASAQVGTVAGEQAMLDLSGYGLSASPTPSPLASSPPSQPLTLNRERARFAVLTGLGLLCLALSFLLYLRRRRQKPTFEL